MPAAPATRRALAARGAVVVAALWAPMGAAAQDASSPRTEAKPVAHQVEDDRQGARSAGAPAAHDASDEQPPAPPSAEDDQRARELFVQGRDAYDDGDYRGAWDYFHQAYVLSRRPQLLYNVGQAADRLRLDKEALEAFRLYLKKLPDADNRREVENRIAALEQRVEAEPAAPGEGPAEDEPDPFAEENAETPDPFAGDQPTRSGWAFRGAVGVGLFADSVDGAATDLTVSSGALGFHAVAGYGLSSSLILGVGVLLDSGLAPQVDVAGVKSDIDSAGIFSAHALVDYYLSPRDNGWHVMGGLGFATFRVSDSGAVIGTRDASGGAVLLAGGYEWPFGQQWAIGALARVLLARMTDDDRTHIVFAPNIAFTGIWY